MITVTCKAATALAVEADAIQAATGLPMVAPEPKMEPAALQLHGGVYGKK